MSKGVFYLAGPYRSKKINGIFENILNARKTSLKYWKKGYTVITPHLNTMLFDGELNDTSFLDGDLEILSRCDGIIMMSNFKKSVGSVKELEFAKSKGLEVIYD